MLLVPLRWGTDAKNTFGALLMEENPWGMIYPEPVSSKWQLFSDKAGTFFPKKTGCRTASGKPLWDFCL